MRIASLIIICQLANLALMRARQIMQEEPANSDAAALGPVIDHLDGAHDHLMQIIVAQRKVLESRA